MHCLFPAVIWRKKSFPTTRAAPASRRQTAPASWMPHGKKAAPRQGMSLHKAAAVQTFLPSASGLTVVERDIDFVSGNQRYFSDYVAGKNCVTLYLRSVDLWAQQNKMTRMEAENLILSHEYYHFLEWNKLGLTSRDYQVPMISIGPLRLGKTGIRALSEIGAHGFAHTYHQLLEAQHGTH